MKRVTIESPYAGNVEVNEGYAKECLLDSLERGEAPFASHLLYTRVLDDNVHTHRELGLTAAMEYVKSADLVAVYTDHGVSRGMERAMRTAQSHSVQTETRQLKSLRQTGRTHGMVQEAVLCAQQGKTVLILAGTDVMAKHIHDMVRDVSNDRTDCIRVVTLRDQDTVRGLQADEVFVDHFTWNVKPLATFEALARLGKGRRP